VFVVVPFVTVVLSAWLDDEPVGAGLLLGGLLVLAGVYVGAAAGRCLRRSPRRPVPAEVLSSMPGGSAT
jgi:drug/metabolite transporter (DMT)-like permease